VLLLDPEAVEQSRYACRMVHASRVVVMALLVAGCGQREESAARAYEPEPAAAGSQPAMPAPEAGSATGQGSGSAAPPPALAVPATPGPLPPFDRLRPRMKEADARNALADAGVKQLDAAPAEITTTSGDVVFTTPHPAVFAILKFYYDRRLSGVAFETTSADALATPVLARWGVGNVDASSWRVEHKWPANATGWSATLRVPKKDQDMFAWTRSSLDLYAEVTETPAMKTLVLSAGMWTKLASVLGKSLDAADTTLGAPLTRETSDDEDGAPERGAQRQGFATLSAPWSNGGWELVARTDAGQKIVEIELTGRTGGEDQRVALMDALRTAFGPPRPIVSAAGRLEIDQSTGTVVVRSRESDPESWIVTLRRR
jgi:hypothetical protein